MIRNNGGKILSVIVLPFLGYVVGAREVPTVHIVATMTPLPTVQTTMRNSPTHSFSLALKCSATKSDQCTTIDKIVFPGVTEPKLIYPREEIVGKGDTKKVKNITHKGKPGYELQIFSCLQGGESLAVYVGTVGLIDLSELSFQTHRGDELLPSAFNCRTNQIADNKEYECHEIVPIPKRFISIFHS